MNTKEWVREWYRKTYGRDIPVTPEDIDREIEEQEEKNWYYEKLHRQSLINQMANEQARRR